MAIFLASSARVSGTLPTFLLPRVWSLPNYATLIALGIVNDYNERKHWVYAPHLGDITGSY